MRTRMKMPLLVAGSLLTATAVLAAEPPATNSFNCDFDPACEVSPGIYGNLSAPATSKFNLSIGGFIKADFSYNSANYGPLGFLSPTNSPNDNTIGSKKNQAAFSVRQSRLWFRSTGPKLFSAKTSAYLEFDFHNTNNPTTQYYAVKNSSGVVTDIKSYSGYNNSESLNATPRIRHAYGLLSWDTVQLLFGQTSDNHNFLTNAPFYDFSGGAQAGFVSNTRNPQLRITKFINLDEKKNNVITVALALQQPYQNNYNNTGTPATSGQTVSVTSVNTGDSWGGLPVFSGKIAFTSQALGKAPILYGQGFSPLTIGIAGAYGNSKVYTYAANSGTTTSTERHTKTLDSWYGAFYTFLPILSSKDGKNRAGSLSWESQVYLAANSKDATAYQFVGTNATTTADSNIHSARGFGVASSLIYFPTQNIGLSAAYGRRQVLHDGDYKNISNHEVYNQMYAVTAAYDLNAAIRIGAELLHFDTKYGTLGTGLANMGKSNTARLSLYYYF